MGEQYLQENVGGTTYFYPTAANHSANQTSSSIISDTSMALSHHSSSQSMNYSQSVHVYPGPSANVVNMQPRTQLSSAIFVPSEMRNEILARNEIANMIEPTPNPGTNRYDARILWHTLIRLYLAQMFPAKSTTIIR